MTIWFFSDPHLGLERTSHTTQASRRRLQDAVYKAACEATDRVDPVICLGDLFDTTFNPERIIAQGADIAKNCDAVIAGNHDLPNRAVAVSSLELLSNLCHRVITAHSIDEPYVEQVTINKVNLHLIPHCASQGIFEASLDLAVKNIGKNWATQTNVLCLHCNYDNPFADNNATLNLSAERARELSEEFNHVLIGHEHQSRVLYDGALILLGNIHPTSFADIGDKYVWSLDEKGMNRHLVWSAKDHVRELDWKDLAAPLPEGIQFVTVTGKADAEEAGQVAKAIYGLWQQNEGLYMVRNQVQYDQMPAAEVNHINQLQDLPSRITEMLRESDLLPLWKEYLGRLA